MAGKLFVQYFKLDVLPDLCFIVMFYTLVFHHQYYIRCQFVYLMMPGISTYNVSLEEQRKSSLFLT